MGGGGGPQVEVPPAFSPRSCALKRPRTRTAHRERGAGRSCSKAPSDTHGAQSGGPRTQTGERGAATRRPTVERIGIEVGLGRLETRTARVHDVTIISTRAE